MRFGIAKLENKFSFVSPLTFFIFVDYYAP